MGPRMPCAHSGSEDSASRNVATMIDLLRNAFPLGLQRLKARFLLSNLRYA
jgi:hypothetical protein